MTNRELIEEARLAACSECAEEGTGPAMRCDGDLIRRLVDALEAAEPVQDDVRERLHRCLDGIPGHVWDAASEIDDVTGIIDAILAAFPWLGRDIAGEIEDYRHPTLDERVERINAGLERAAEIARNGR